MDGILLHSLVSRVLSLINERPIVLPNVDHQSQALGTISNPSSLAQVVFRLYISLKRRISRSFRLTIVDFQGDTNRDSRSLSPSITVSHSTSWTSTQSRLVTQHREHPRLVSQHYQQNTVRNSISRTSPVSISTFPPNTVKNLNIANFRGKYRHISTKHGLKSRYRELPRLVSPHFHRTRVESLNSAHSHSTLPWH